ncbi:SGNH/GDSL hydrolase family protein [Arvimicrobium flavum]|uniref:SGNH/GDSL hydrolase family protein n=1 Tax=Arvimicrobium flavum TaxID=3393320 RepID=UPI00237BF7FE|nr:SGNH/GDSL hydrolase family protein [Mesorhizobium shangrilense]
MVILTKKGIANGLLVAVAVVLSYLAVEFAARWALSDISTTGDRFSYMSRQWYAANPPQANKLKFREREFTHAPAPGVMRIAVVGDSFTWAPGLLENERVSNRLDAKLNSAGDLRFEVLNFGVSGANYEQHEVNMRLAIQSANPHFILLQWYLNDLDDPEEPLPRPMRLAGFLHRELTAVSVLYWLAARAFDEAQIKMGKIDVDAYYARFLNPDDPLARRGDERFRDLIQVAREAGVPIGVYMWPELTRPLGTSPNDALIKHMLVLCEEEHIVCVDLSSALRAEKQHERLIVNRFDTHASAEANDLAADLLVVRFGEGWRAEARKIASGSRPETIGRVVQ